MTRPWAAGRARGGAGLVPVLVHVCICTNIECITKEMNNNKNDLGSILMHAASLR